MWRLVLGMLALVAGVRGLKCGFRALGGPAARRWLGAGGRNPYFAVLLGCLLAALLHSSGMVTVIAISALETGTLTFPAALGVVLGANVGTTATAQLASVATGTGSGWVWVGAGLVASVFGWLLADTRLGRALRACGLAVAGAGLVFSALEFFDGAFTAVGAAPGYGTWVSRLGRRADTPWRGLLLGAGGTALTQSSTLFLGMVMGAAADGIVGPIGAINLMLGANVGSCVPGLVAGAAAGPAGSGLAWANLAFNLGGALLALPLGRQLAMLAQLAGGGAARQLANAHTLFNLLTVVLALPFTYAVGDILARRQESARSRKNRK